MLTCNNVRCVNHWSKNCVKLEDRQPVTIDENGTCQTFQVGVSKLYKQVNPLKLHEYTPEEKIRAIKLACHMRIIVQSGREYTVWNAIAADMETLLPELVEEESIFD